MVLQQIDSIIDEEDVLEYQQTTGKQWREDVEERMAEICSFYDYGFNWNEKGNIVINNEFYEGTWENSKIDYYQFFGKSFTKVINGNFLVHYEYESAETMVADWMDVCRETNVDYEEHGMEKPFKWLQ